MWFLLLPAYFARFYCYHKRSHLQTLLRTRLAQIHNEGRRNERSLSRRRSLQLIASRNFDCECLRLRECAGLRECREWLRFLDEQGSSGGFFRTVEFSTRVVIDFSMTLSSTLTTLSRSKFNPKCSVSHGLLLLCSDVVVITSPPMSCRTTLADFTFGHGSHTNFSG